MVKSLLMSIGILLLSACEFNTAPQVHRVGILNGAKIFSEIVDGFRLTMRELGYVEGENIVYDLREVNGDAREQQRILEQFVTDKVDLIFAFPTGSAVAAKAATRGTDIGVVFAMSFLEDTDLVASIQQPGGNLTGVRTPGPAEIVKRLEMLHELVPQGQRIYAVYDAGYPTNDPTIEALEPVAAALGITLVAVPVSSWQEVRTDLEARSASDDVGMDAILIMADPLSNSPPAWKLISQFAEKHQLAIGGGAHSLAESGAVFSYVPDPKEIGRLAAISADKVLRGTPPGSIPVATPTSSLRINYGQAEKLGLTVPRKLLNLAAEVIR